MPRIVNPATRFNYKIDGIILLEYKGENVELFNRKSFRRGQLIFDFSESKKSKNTILAINFKEFFNLDLRMDLFSNSIFLNDTHQRIGDCFINSFNYDATSLVCSGYYRHEPITLAYHMDDLINYDAMFDLSNINIKRFQNDMNHFLNTFPDYKSIIKNHL